MTQGGVSRFPENGLASSSRPSSSQKKKGRLPFIRKSISIARRKKKPATEDRSQKMRSRLYSYRAELRPLLDAIRFVESGNRVDCPDGDGGASIGPLQISKNYHLDAWEHKRAHFYSWNHCRNLDHAENTVVLYWMRYCSDALSKQDWEVLAKTHNGGPQGPKREKTAYYWSKVSRYLEGNPTFSSPPLPYENYPVSSASFTVLDVKHGLMVRGAERQKPIVSRLRRPPLLDISSSVNVEYGGLRLDHGMLQMKNSSDEASCEPLKQDYIYLNFKPAALEQQEKELQDEATQSPSRQSGCEENDAGSPIDGIVENGQSCPDGETDRRSSHEYWSTPQSFGTEGRLDILYSDELSEQKEEEILTELARLLPFGLPENMKQASGCFEFPCATVEVDCATPVLKRDKQSSSELESADADVLQSSKLRVRSISAEFDATATTEAQDEEPLLTPHTEDNLLSELADLFHLPQPEILPPTETKVEDDVVKTTAANLSMADFLLEIPDPSASVQYVKALFSCEDMLLEKLCDRIENVEESQDSSRPTAAKFSPGTEVSRTPDVPGFSSCSCHCTSNDRLTLSLGRLCTVWEEQDVDLLTRSLRFRMLNLKNSSEAPATIEAPCIAWEINALKSIPRNAKSQKAAKELIKKQRDMIYVNIGAYASNKERHRLYARWGVRKLANGRLKKLVYELLWKDSRRYQESAELVSSFI